LPILSDVTLIDLTDGKKKTAVGLEVWRKNKYSASVLVSKDFGGALLARDLIKWKQSTLGAGIGVIHEWNTQLDTGWKPVAGVTVRW